MTTTDRRDIVNLLRFAQWSLLAHASAMDAARVLPGQAIPIACNASTVLRRDASRAADLIELLERKG